MSFPANPTRNFIVNPSGTTPGEIETKMRCGAWWLLSLSPISGMPDLRGGGDGNVVLAGLDGRLAVNPLIDQGTYVMELRICGDVDASGTAATGSRLDVMEQNIEFLRANVGSPIASATRTSKLVRPWITLTDDVQTRIKFGTQKGAEMTAAFTVVVPGGIYGG